MSPTSGFRKPATRRGQPLGALVVLLVGWSVLRVMTWQSPFVPNLPVLAANEPVARMRTVDPAQSRHESTGPTALSQASALPGSIAPQPVMPGWSTAPLPSGLQGLVQPEPAVPAASQTAVAHQLLFLAGMAYIPVPPAMAGVMARAYDPGDRYRQAGSSPKVPLRARNDLDRWHLDAWAFYRPRGGGGAFAAAGAPYPSTYGGSQAGAVVHYVLDEGNSGPELFLRATATPEQPRQTEIAFGFGARPVAALPVRAQAELRAFNQSGQTEIRPAIVAVTQVAPARLPLGFVGEGYAQAGYVAGRFSTGFADGQLRIARPVASLDGVRLRLGGGAWGGAQKDAARLDIGPSATLDLTNGPIPLRMSADYRIRAAGDAQPNSGLAITLSTGF